MAKSFVLIFSAAVTLSGSFDSQPARSLQKITSEYQTILEHLSYRWGMLDGLLSAIGSNENQDVELQKIHSFKGSLKDQILALKSFKGVYETAPEKIDFDAFSKQKLETTNLLQQVDEYIKSFKSRTVTERARK